VATILKRKNSDGSRSFIAQVRIRPFKPVAKAFPSKPDALAWAAALETELKDKRKRGGLRQDVATLTVRKLAEEFLADPETKALRSFDSLELLLSWWTNHYGHERVREFGVLRLREARERLTPGRAPATVNRHLSALRSAWNWGRANGLVPQDYVWPTRLLLTEPRGRTRSLSDPELAELLKAAADNSAVMHAAIVVSIATGVRQSELLRLTWADVDMERGTVRVTVSKNGDTRAVYLPASAAEVLKALKRAPVVGRHVFLNEKGKPLHKGILETRWRLIRAAAGLQDFRWHDLRHSCASFLAQNGATLLEIGSVLGHRSPSATKRYAHLVEGAPVTGHAALNSKLLPGGRQ
jgi:integrase